VGAPAEIRTWYVPDTHKSEMLQLERTSSVISTAATAAAAAPPVYGIDDDDNDDDDDDDNDEMISVELDITSKIMIDTKNIY
jgi:hypothetical protein